MPFGEGRGDLAVEKILAALLGGARQRIAEPAGAGLIVDDQRAVLDRGGDLARQRRALVADLDVVLRRAAGVAAVEPVRPERDAVSAQLQQRLGRQDAIAAPDADAPAILSGAA